MAARSASWPELRTALTLALAQLSEAGLRASEQCFRLIAECSPDLIAIVDPQLRVTYLNREPPPQLRLTRAQVPGMSIAELIHPEFAIDAIETIRRVLDTGEPATYDAPTPCGGLRYLCRVTLLPRGDHQPQALITATDVTEARRAEAERARLQARLQRARRLEALGQLTSSVAHDFNDILYAIQNHLDFARSAIAAGDDPLPKLEAVAAAAARAEEVIRNLLTVGGRPRGVPRLVDLRELVHRSADRLRRTIPASIALDAAVGAQPLWVRADPEQLEQVLLDLGLNAADALDDSGSIQLELARAKRALAGVSGRWLTLSVHDTGLGMDEATMARAFEPFFTTKAMGRGAGLGLSMVHNLVTQNGGHIEIDSVLGEGTTFTVHLPEVEVIDGGPPRAHPRGTQPILVADDDPAVRKLVVRVLERAGYRVLETEGGHRAVEPFCASSKGTDLRGA